MKREGVDLKWMVDGNKKVLVSFQKIKIFKVKKANFKKNFKIIDVCNKSSIFSSFYS